jgi:hypothetical protein
MQYILTHEKLDSSILLNRNPTINMGSYLAMNVASVKDDYSDLSCSLPIQCLQSLNADFDGDTLNITKEITTEFKRAFKEVFFPRTGFMIDHNNGLINSDFGFIKDETISLYNFCTI